MLKLRIATALVLLGILVPTVFNADANVFAGVAGLFITAAAWEWGNMNQCKGASSLFIGLLCGFACAASFYGGILSDSMPLLWIMGGFLWVALGAWLLHGGQAAWAKIPTAIRLMGGVFALWMAWVAVSQARMVGINFLFSILVLVWVADIFAYIFGRSLGGRFFKNKLAPTISPGKTWEGVLGGLCGVVVCALVWLRVDAALVGVSPSIFTRMAEVHIAFLILCSLFLGAMSVVGDLVESLFKRNAGIKDSSGLLPGHGGVLDRIDALLPTLPLAMMMVTFT